MIGDSAESEEAARERGDRARDFAIPRLVRVARAETLGLREQEFVSAAVVNGAGDATILRRHVLPNMASTLLVQATVAIPAAIIGESVLSFLGLGVQPPTPSWGVMLSSAQPFLSLAAWLAIFPGLLLLATLSFNLLGDGLRDALDPRRRLMLTVEDLSVRFASERGPVQAVEDVSFAVEDGGALAIVGESGCGKSVTAMALLGCCPAGAACAGGRGSPTGTCSCPKAQDVRGRRSRWSSRSR